MNRPSPLEQILREIQNATETAKCVKCGIELNYLQIGGREYHCEPCSKIRHATRLSQAHTPTYDIDKILESESSLKILQSIASISESDSEHRPIPWSSLLPTEAICRSYVHFDNLMGNGFATLLQYGGGPEIFIRGHDALEAVEATAALEVTRAAKLIMEKHGISFPEDVPQDWWDEDDGIDLDLYEAIDPELQELDSKYWGVDAKAVRALFMEHIRANIDLLRSRKLPRA